MSLNYRGGGTKRKLQWIRVTWSLAHTAINFFKKTTKQNKTRYTHLHLNLTPLCCPKCTERGVLCGRLFVCGESVRSGFVPQRAASKRKHEQLLHHLAALSLTQKTFCTFFSRLHTDIDHNVKKNKINGIRHQKTSEARSTDTRHLCESMGATSDSNTFWF